MPSTPLADALLALRQEVETACDALGDSGDPAGWTVSVQAELVCTIDGEQRMALASPTSSPPGDGHRVTVTLTRNLVPPRADDPEWQKYVTDVYGPGSWAGRPAYLPVTLPDMRHPTYYVPPRTSTRSARGFNVRPGPGEGW